MFVLSQINLEAKYYKDIIDLSNEFATTLKPREQSVAWKLYCSLRNSHS